MSKRKQFIEGVAGGQLVAMNGRCTVAAGSYQMSPPTDRPFKVRGQADTDKTERAIVLSFDRDEARKLVQDWISFGLFGRHGRVVETTQ